MSFVCSPNTDLVDLGNYVIDLNQFSFAKLVEQSGTMGTGITLKNGTYILLPNEFVFHKLKEYCRLVTI